MGFLDIALERTSAGNWKLEECSFREREISFLSVQLLINHTVKNKDIVIEIFSFGWSI